jgi:hypothetical protein
LEWRAFVLLLQVLSSSLNGPKELEAWQHALDIALHSLAEAFPKVCWGGPHRLVWAESSPHRRHFTAGAVRSPPLHPGARGASCPCFRCRACGCPHGPASVDAGQPTSGRRPMAVDARLKCQRRVWSRAAILSWNAPPETIAHAHPLPH